MNYDGSSSFLYHDFKTFISAHVYVCVLVPFYLDFFFCDELLMNGEPESHFNCVIILCMLSKRFPAILKIISLNKKKCSFLSMRLLKLNHRIAYNANNVHGGKKNKCSIFNLVFNGHAKFIRGNRSQ